MEFAKIVFYTLAVAMGFGFAYEAVAAAACVEYFTYDRRAMVLTENPLFLGLQFAFLGWSWVGAALGCSLAVAARIGGEIQIKPAFFLRPLIALFVLVSVVTATGAIMGYFGETSGRYPLMTNWAQGLAREKHAPYVALIWSHIGAYTSALLGGMTLVAWTWKKRRLFTEMSRKNRGSPPLH